MKGITTLAALPSGSGQAAHLPAEVSTRREAARPRSWQTIWVSGVFNLWPGQTFEFDGKFYVCMEIRDVDGGAEITCYRDERFKGD